MKPKLPHARLGRNSALAEVIEESSANAAMTFSQMAVAMSFFIEALADKVASGKVVSIPGFGQFAPWATESWQGEHYVAPRFQSALGFRNLVKVGCLVCKACNVTSENYRRNHTLEHSKPVTSDRTFMAQLNFRQTVLKDAARRFENPSVNG